MLDTLVGAAIVIILLVGSIETLWHARPWNPRGRYARVSRVTALLYWLIALILLLMLCFAGAMLLLGHLGVVHVRSG